MSANPDIDLTGLAGLRAALPEAAYSDVLADRELAATDVFNRREVPAAVLTPSTLDELVTSVRESAQAGFAVVVKGGGASYTDAYLPETRQSVSIDMRHLNRVVAIDDTNRTVTVEAGCTWASLREALAARGWRTPFFGPFSGLVATVGGSVSQNAVSHGTGAYGTSAESVVSMDVVLANGAVLRTGSGGANHDAGAPRRFLRHFGPDTTGLFTGDCGALGVKALITLPLYAADKFHTAASFWFADFSALHAGMASVAELGLDDENFALDISLQQGQIARTEANGEALKIAWRVFRSSPTVLRGAGSLLRMAAAGTSHLQKPGYTAHYITRSVDSLTANARMSAIRDRALQYGREIPNTIAEVVAAMPFAPLHNVLGPTGERWVPIHGVLQHTDVAAFHRAWESLLAEYQPRLDDVGGFAGGMYQAVSPSAFLYEIAFYWRDARNVYHEAVMDDDYLASLPTYPEDLAARELLTELKDKAVALMQQHGAAHFQIGRAYPYLDGRNPADVALLRAVKAELDPDNLINPGVLGL